MSKRNLVRTNCASLQSDCSLPSSHELIIYHEESTGRKVKSCIQTV